MAIEFRSLSVQYAKTHATALMEAQYQELTLHKEVIKLNMDWRKYERMEEQGMLMSLGVFEDNELIGYCVFLLDHHARYKDIIMASNDVIYLRADKRKKAIGIQLIQESEKALRKRKVTKVLWHCKYDTALGDLLPKLGYTNEEFIVSKLLGE